MSITGAQPPGRGKPKATLDLVSSVEAVVPGRPFDGGLRFQLEKGWHIYWKNAGDAGLPPRINWSLPEGFRVGELRFPAPKRYVSPGDIVTYIHDGEPMLLIQVTPPERIAADRVSLSGELVYLVCRENCIRETTTVRLELPVRADANEPRPANSALFERARAARPGEKSKSLTVSGGTDPASVTPGQPFEVLIRLDIAPGLHIQSNQPTLPNLIACELFLERPDGVYYKDPVFPPSKMRRVPVLGELSEFSGSVAIRVPAEVDAESPAPDRFGGVLRFQACNEQGNCFPPEALAFSFPAGPPAKKRAGAPPQEVGDREAAALTSAEPDAPAGAETASAAPAAHDETTQFLMRFGLAGLLMACFIYGLAINATPCVLPILSIKVLGFVQQAHESRGRTLVLGLAFGAGVLLFFVILGFLAGAGTNIFHYPAAIIALCSVVTALALSMLGVYSLNPPSAAAKLDASIGHEGLLASFGKGSLAPVLGFACTGPLLAGAFAWATQQPAQIAVLAFLSAGLGMAFPYILLGANPHWLGFLPKPGPWMITFERIMGFLLLGMVIWLLAPLVGRIGAEGLLWTLGFLLTVSMACWLLGKVDFSMPGAVRWRYRGAAGLLVLFGALVIYGWVYPLSDAVARQRLARQQASSVGDTRLAADGDHDAASGKIAWRPWSPESVREAVASGHTVFVDFTADYCTNCKVNKAAAITRPEAIEKMERLGVVAFQADFSDGDRTMFRAMQRFGRPGPPLNLVYPAGRLDEPIVLPVLFSLSDLLAAFDEAGPSRVASAAERGA